MKVDSNIPYLHRYISRTIAFSANLVHAMAKLVQFGAGRSDGARPGQGGIGEGKSGLLAVC